MNIIDYSKEFKSKKEAIAKHSQFFPKNIFCVIAGATGSGKTNLLVNLLRTKEILNYSDVYIYSSTLYQEAYEHLKEYYETLQKFRIHRL
jgi:ABC-type lipoprotein export system ATPase subunit